MINKEALVHEWYFTNVNPENLDKNIRASLDYFKRVGERGRLTLWAHEIVSGGYRKSDAARVFLDNILYQGNENYKIRETSPKYDEIMADFREVKGLVTNIFNEHTGLSGHFKVDYNQADGSLGLFYVVYI